VSGGVTSELVLASRNEHKLREFGRLLPETPLSPLPEGAPSPEETGETFADNALLKAHAAVAVTGRASIADDSGIEADALGGAPGVRSARYAGEQATDGENLAKLREEVRAGSRLRYVCVIAHVAADGTEHHFEGTCEGSMSADVRGAGGFGYDPVFVPDDTLAAGRTMAELSDGEKDAISHRGRAARGLLEWMAAR
jgi:XTP/dITP diphosphohydrolase